jgi:hypothetical protein
MTLVEIRNQVITVLLKNNMFIMNTDSKSIKVPKALSAIKELLIESSFELLQNAEYVKKFKSEENLYWILEKDIANSKQEVQVSPYTSEAIANIINQYREAMNIKHGECNKLKIVEDDLQSMVVICSTLLNNVESKESPEQSGDKEF